MRIGEIIKARRLELGLTLEEVGAKVGVGKSTVRKWETGIIENMRRDKIALLSSVLDIPYATLIGEEEKKESAGADELSPTKRQLLDLVSELSESEAAVLLASLKSALGKP